MGTTIGLIKGDTGSLDGSSYLGFPAQVGIIRRGLRVDTRVFVGYGHRLAMWFVLCAFPHNPWVLKPCASEEEP